MPTCLNYNCTDAVEDQLLNDCEEELQGGADAAIILTCDHQLTDPSDAVEVQAEIDAGRAFVYENLKIGIEEPSPVEVDSNIACRSPKRVTDERSGTWIDGNVNDTNRSAYDTLKNNTVGGIVIRECAADQVSFIDDAVQFKGGRILPNNENEFQFFNMPFAWKSKFEPTLHAVPAGIFST